MRPELRLFVEVTRIVEIDADQILHRLVRRCADDKKEAQPPYQSGQHLSVGLNEQVRAVTVQAQGRLSGLEDECPPP